MKHLKLVTTKVIENNERVDNEVGHCPCICHKSKLDYNYLGKKAFNQVTFVLICEHCLLMQVDDFERVSKTQAAEVVHEDYLFHQSKTDGTVEANFIHQETVAATSELGMQATGGGKQRPGLNFAGMDNDTSANPNQNEHVHDESRGAAPENRPQQTPSLGHSAKPSFNPTPSPIK